MLEVLTAGAAHDADLAMILRADARYIPLIDGCVQTVVTSPPYWGLRDYGVSGQIGLEPTPESYVATMVGVFREVRRVLRDDGTVWLNLGDSYAGSGKGWGGGSISENSGHLEKMGGNGTAKQAGINSGLVPPGLKAKDLCGIPWRVAFALQADGWYLRSDIIWAKPNPMPESVTDRPTRSHEYIFLLSKSERYFYDADAIAEDAIHAGKEVSLGEKSLSKGQANGAGIRASGNGNAQSVMVAARRNKRSVWTVNSEPTPEAHFATFPQKLIEPCVLAGSRTGDLVLDPFIGSGTVGKVAERFGRRWVGLELSESYIGIAKNRTAQLGMQFGTTPTSGTK
jgi:DNA modification methylase